MRLAARERDVFAIPGYLPFWLADTVSTFGSHVTTIALQVLVVLTLKGTATDVGLLNAARWLPYLVLGLVLGALVDRMRRKPTLLATDLGRALLLCAIPALWLMGWLSLPVLMLFVAAFGVLTVLNDAASQSFLPRLVPPSALLAANARLDQGGAVAQASGPVIAGALITAIGAPLAVLADAASYLVSALAISRVHVAEPAPAKGRPLNLRREIGEGLRWVYGHRMLAPMALSTHGWFLFNSLLTTVFVPFVLLDLGLTALDLGLTLAAAGGAGLVGSMLAARIGTRWGAGGAVVATRVMMPVAWTIIALVPVAGGDPWITVAALAAGQGLYGFAMGAENANSMGYRQAVTPDALQGRMNTTMRSINRGMNVIGAPVGGLLADSLGYRPTLWIGVAGFALVAVYVGVSPFRRARHGDRPRPE